MNLLRNQSSLIKEKTFPCCCLLPVGREALIPGFLRMGVNILNPNDPCRGIEEMERIK